MVLTVLALVLPAVVGVGPRASAVEGGGRTPALAAGRASRAPAARQEVPAPVLRARQGLFVRRNGSPDLEFVEWRSELTANQIIGSLDRVRGGTLYFAPGRYEVRHGIFIHGVNRVAIIGAPGAELVFAPPRATPPPRLIEPAAEGERHLLLDRPDALSVGGRYQLHPAGGRGDRLLEFVAREVDGARITLDRPISFMAHVAAIPAGAMVVEELNFFRIYRANDVVLEGLMLDGLGRGDVLGHTTYCGVIVENGFLEARAAGAPLFAGLRIVGNTFRNLKGRGVAIYGTGNVGVQRNRFVHIGQQAIEIDHFSSALVSRNRIRAAAVGVQLDDAFDTVVERNKVQRAPRGIVLLGHFDDPWANSGNRIVRNTLIGRGAIGVSLSERSRDNVIARNRVTGMDTSVGGRLAGNSIDEEEHR